MIASYPRPLRLKPGLSRYGSASMVSVTPRRGKIRAMSRIFNRRNAVVGWVAWTAGRRRARKRMRAARKRLLLAASVSIAAFAVGGASLAGRRGLSSA